MVLDLEPDHPQRMKLLNLIEKYRAGGTMTVESAPPAKPPAKPKTETKPAAKPAAKAAKK